jgi:hypothetical protein
MGCTGSKHTDPKEARKIKSEFGTTNVPKFDEFFENATTLLENAELIRAGVQDGKEDAQELTDTYRLKDYQFIEAIRVIFWSLSANAEGNIKNSNIGVISEPPFVTFNEFSGLTPETKEACDAFASFLEAVTSGPEAIVEIVKSLGEMAGKGTSLVLNAKSDLEEAGLSSFDKIKGLAILTKNLAQLSKQLPKVKNIAPLMAEAAKDVQALAPKFVELLKTCDAIGAKAFEAGHLTPKAIFEHYHTGAKKSEAEIEAEKALESETHTKKKKISKKQKNAESLEQNPKENEDNSNNLAQNPQASGNAEGTIPNSYLTPTANDFGGVQNSNPVNNSKCENITPFGNNYTSSSTRNLSQNCGQEEDANDEIEEHRTNSVTEKTHEFHKMHHTEYKREISIKKGLIL